MIAMYARTRTRTHTHDVFVFGFARENIPTNRSIVCIHCKLRLGVTDLRADAVRCSECGKTTKVHDARERQVCVCMHACRATNARFTPATLPRAPQHSQSHPNILNAHTEIGASKNASLGSDEAMP